MKKPPLQSLRLPLCGFTLCCIALSACMSLAERGGRLLDGSAFSEKILETYTAPEPGPTMYVVRIRSLPAPGTRIVLVSRSFPAFKLYLQPVEGEGTGGIVHVYPAACSFLSSTLSGWNEWTMELSGSGTLVVNGNRRTLRLESIDVIDIAEGRIRRGETKLAGQQALTALKNRRERIDALTAWMRGRTGAPPVFQSQADFETYWEPIVLPEMVSRKKRPPDYDENSTEWARAEDRSWNAAYSRLFPEDIALLRNTGALLRDWEEALPWIYLSYQWDALLKELSKTTRFTKK